MAYIRGRPYEFIKRAADIVAALAGLAVLSPLLAATAAAVTIDDPHGGPVFSQVRVGRDGRTFRFYKFRSMHVGAEDALPGILRHNERSGPVFKMADDPRVTRVGRFIRRTSIDELPQLVNVLLGDMSIVGPRPPLPREVAQYGEWEMGRLAVKPGLTCYWQSRPDRYDVPFTEWVRSDLEYINNRGILTDVGIIIRTARTVLTHTGQ